MPYESAAYPRYNKRRKRLSDKIKEALSAEEDKILINPKKGDQKTGPLKGVWVEKFKAGNDQILVAYEIDEKNKCVTFLDVGQHENFYRDLQKHVK